MPLTNEMAKIKKAMLKTYGKEKGEEVFYAWENKHKQMKKKYGRKR